MTESSTCIRKNNVTGARASKLRPMLATALVSAEADWLH
jgi:hypothetical protein